MDDLVVGCITVSSSDNGDDPVRYGQTPTELSTIVDSFKNQGYTETASTDTTSSKSSTLVNGSDTVVVTWALYQYLTGRYLPEFFREKPLPAILVSLLDASIKRDVQGTIDILNAGGLIREDDIGILRLAEYGADELSQVSLLGPEASRPERLLAISRLTESFSKIKGQKKAIQLILRLLGMSGEIIEYDDERRGTSPFNQGLEPGQVVVIGGIDPTIGADLLAANPGKSAEAVLEELIDLFAWAHIRFAGILVAEQFLNEFLFNPTADITTSCFTHCESSSYCPFVCMPEFSYHPETGALIEGAAIGTKVRIDRFATGMMEHRITVGPYGCTDIDGNLQDQWNLDDPDLVVGGSLFCDLGDMNGVDASLFIPIFIGDAPNSSGWNLDDTDGLVVGGFFPSPYCFSSQLQTIVTDI